MQQMDVGVQKNQLSTSKNFRAYSSNTSPEVNCVVEARVFTENQGIKNETFALQTKVEDKIHS